MASLARQVLDPPPQLLQRAGLCILGQRKHNFAHLVDALDQLSLLLVGLAQLSELGLELCDSGLVCGGGWVGFEWLWGVCVFEGVGSGGRMGRQLVASEWMAIFLQF